MFFCETNVGFGWLHILAFGKNGFYFCTVLTKEFLTCHRPKAYFKNSLYQVSLLDLNHPGSSLPPTLGPLANTLTFVDKQRIHLCLQSGDNATCLMPVSHSCQLHQRNKSEIFCSLLEIIYMFSHVLKIVSEVLKFIVNVVFLKSQNILKFFLIPPLFIFKVIHS